MKMIFVVLIAMGISPALAAKRALIYNGPGACSDGCYQSAYQVALEAGLDPVYVGPKDLDIFSSEHDRAQLFKDAAIWIQPGGKSSIAINSMTTVLKDAIKKFVNMGGGYVGFCAGAFASTALVGTTEFQGFNFLPGKTILYPDAIHPDGADILAVEWQGKIRHLYWEGGPYITDLPAGKAEVIAHYPDGKVAAARSHYGAGKVFVTGLHPEAPQDWRDYYGLQDPDGLDHDLATDMIHWATTP